MYINLYYIHNIGVFCVDHYIQLQIVLHEHSAI